MAAVAQTPVSSLPYFCGFEDIVENANWTLNRRGGIGASTPLPSMWTIGTGGRHSGLNGLYIYTGTAQDAAEYDGTREVFTVAEREFRLQPGTYDLAFDWRCLGDANSDAIYVYWVPATTTLNARANSTLPTNATPLTFNGTNFFSGSAKWQQARTTVAVNSNQNYRLIFAWRNNTTNTYNPGACLDNVQLQLQEQASDCWHSVTNIRWTEGQTADVLSWQGPAGADVTYDIYYWLEGDFRIDSVMGVTENSYTFLHGDLNSGLYSFAIRTNCGDESSIQSELLNVKSRGDYSLIAEACPDVSLIAHKIVNGEKFLRPACDEAGMFRVKPNTVAGGGSIAGYRVDPIDYSECPFPFEFRLAQLLMGSGSGNYLRQIHTDDVWDNQVLSLPFKVCFFDGTYAQAVVCSNGIVSFDTQVLGQSAGYLLTSQPDIPSADFGGAPGTGLYWRNAIYGVFQDYDPAYGGEIWYGVLGEWPCRKMVVCWNQVPMFNNHDVRNSSMIVMYEGTNVIDVYVKNRDLSTGWNDNRGIIGLQNADGSDGVAAPGRNTTNGDNHHNAWTARQEAWRFSPYSTPTFALTWYKGSFATPTDIDNYLRQNPDADIELALADSISINKEDSINAVTVRLQYSQCNGDYIDIVDHAQILWPHTDTLVVDTFTCLGRPYNDRYINRADTAGSYEVIIPDSYGCDSIVYQLNLKHLTKDTATVDTTICPGQILDYKGIRVGEPGVWPVTLKYSNCDCDSITEFVNLSVLDKLEVNLLDFPERICGDDSILSFLLESTISDARYSLHFEPANAGFEDVDNVEMGELSSILVRMSGEVAPGWYTMYYDVDDPACGSAHDSVRFVVNYPSSIAPQKWNNVLVLLDTENNGGYAFSAIQWYKNGQPIGTPDQTVLYLEGESFDPNAEYTVGLVRFGESEEILSCPLGDHATGFDRLDTPSELPIVFDGQMTVYDVLGRVVIQSSYDHGMLMQWLHSHGQPAVYMVRLSSKDTDLTYRFLSR